MKFSFQHLLQNHLYLIMHHFVKSFQFCEIGEIVNNVLINDEPSINSSQSLSLKDRNWLFTNEIIKMFTNQISSLKKLTYNHIPYNNDNISFTYFLDSNLTSDFFNQLSQICHNLQLISIKFNNNDNVSNELKELISLQNKLKILILSAYNASWVNIIPDLTRHSNTITKLHLYGKYL